MKSMVFHYKKLTAISFLAGSTLCGIIAAKPPQQEKEKYKNLKVLSYNISEKDMDYVMEGFNAYLGVTCTFCHPYIKNGYDYYNDFVSDEFRNKRIARDMMRMTMKLNKKYFNTPLNAAMTTRGRVWCKTCHQGSPIPALSTR